ncbi:IPT/TIG domain-containing protein [Pelotomaculum isophthalicicum JI]|uniref:IPT/TIG domain-containing protein n=1 Tax=Pelotomaculum isophthalicicum JI TaxID=947010 RepID=A0A9X4JV98_9FIRM|nr:IPT/TIG domain-containing protein [Pelotomaculum isophthalicicum]MDF9407123.1 IPT/TIG domain-containing protein [Pelotomaculum isophthalicicum JI]
MGIELRQRHYCSRGGSDFDIGRRRELESGSFWSCADLSSLVLSTESLSPVFSSSVTSYSTDIDISITSITVTPTALDTVNAAVYVNGVQVSSGSASSPINLSEGPNTVNILVRALDGITNTYTVTVNRVALLAPVINGISPITGPASGGTTVTISGTGLSAVSAVKFGSTAAINFTLESDTSMIAISPAGSGTVDVAVYGPGGWSATSISDQFTYVQPQARLEPAITPSGGTFTTSQEVSINNPNSTVTSSVYYNLNMIMPGITSIFYNGPFNITQTTTVTAAVYDSGTGLWSAPATATFTKNTPAPVVTSINPSSGPATGGTTITITGTGLSTVTGVFFGSIPAAGFTLGTDTAMTAVSPPGSGTVDVNVCDPGGYSSLVAGDRFTYISGTPPQLQSATISGSLITLLFNEQLDDTSVPASTDFTISANGSSVNIQYVLISGNSLLLTIETPISDETAISFLSYTRGQHPIRDTEGNDVTNFRIGMSSSNGGSETDQAKPHMLNGTPTGTLVKYHLFIPRDAVTDTNGNPITGDYDLYFYTGQ